MDTGYLGRARRYNSGHEGGLAEVKEETRYQD